jgi:hypothetical protein
MSSKSLVILGLALILIGGGLMVFGKIRYRDTDPVVKELGISKTETKEKGMPLALTGTLIGVGAALTVVGALKSRK